MWQKTLEQEARSKRQDTFLTSYFLPLTPKRLTFAPNFTLWH